MIVLRNPGLLEIDLITTMGAHVKESDSYLGKFGTGMKYAIAVLLRNNITFDLAIGENVYEFYTEVKNIRGKDFHICYMRSCVDSICLGFTTDLGKNWELWMSYRELFTNSVIDEIDGEVYHCSKEDSPIPRDNWTMFRIYDEIDIDGVFLQEMDCKLIFGSESVDIYKGSSKYLYYQGIRAKQLHIESMYTYNIKSPCTLSEDRLLCYDFQVSRQLSKSIISMGHEHKNLIEGILTAGDSCWESKLDFSEARGEVSGPSSAFIETYHTVPIKERNKSSDSLMEYYTPKPVNTKTKYEQFLDELTSLCKDYEVDYRINDQSSNIKIIELIAKLPLEESNDRIPF